MGELGTGAIESADSPSLPIPTETVDVVVIVGTRPEAIKLFPVVAALENHPRLRPFVISTGQHAEMVNSVFGAAGLQPDVDLEVGRPGLLLNELSAATIAGVEKTITERYGPAPAAVGESATHPVIGLVHGDTSSAAAGALALFHNRIPVAHVEAGLRTFDTQSPFPEELNRQLITRIASLHFAPTAENLQNLIREGIDVGQIAVTGNTGIDAFIWAAHQDQPYERPELQWLETDTETPVVTITAHRRENWGTGITDIATAIKTLAETHPDTKFVWPVHPNPKVAATVKGVLDGVPNVILTEPLDYVPFARLLARSKLVITDSGGIQEEAPTLGVPVLVARDATERGEGIAAGTIKLVGTNPTNIVRDANKLLTDEAERQAMASKANPYGDGHAAERIIAALSDLAFQTPTPDAYGPAYTRTQVLSHTHQAHALNNREPNGAAQNV